MKFLDPDDTSTIHLHCQRNLPERCHVFDVNSIRAVNAALAAGRPLLVLGEPGVGKSQLARAVANKLERVFVSAVIDSQTESRDLLYHVDAVQRLADAQIKAALAVAAKTDAKKLENDLAAENYLRPGPLWWAFDWKSAKRNGQVPPQELCDPGKPSNGAVLLIDEIDKGQPELPNGLLEALGDSCFTAPGRAEPVSVGEQPPLIIITSNDERDLPAAFVRRCLVMRMSLPSSPGELKKYLCRLGAEHQPMQDSEVQRMAANLLSEDRAAAEREGARPLPGLAEYLDTLRALDQLYPGDALAQQTALQEIARYTSGKHSQLRPPAL